MHFNLFNQNIIENNLSNINLGFEDKNKIYSGQQRRGKNKEISKIAELHEIVANSEFNEKEIEQRNKQIIDEFFEFLRSENLLAQ
jgi:Spy/CpxP family protein refolding chaperone